MRATSDRWQAAAAALLLTALGFWAAASSALLVAAAFAALGMVACAGSRPVGTLWAVLLAIVLVPSYVRIGVPGMPMVPASLALTLVLTGVMFVAALIGPPGVSSSGSGRRLGIAFLLYAGIALLSLYFDPRSSAATYNLWIKTIAAPTALCLTVLFLLRDTRDLERMFMVLTVACLVAVAYAIAEFATGRNPLLAVFFGGGQVDMEGWEWLFQGEDFERQQLVHRVYSVFINPIEFGCVMSLLLPYLLLRLADARSPGARWAWLAAAGGTLLGVALSFSRGPMLAIVVTTALLAVAVGRLRRYVAWGAVVGAIAAVVAWLVLGEKLQDRTLDAANVTLRFRLWTIAMNMALDHPVLGVGYGNFPAYQVDTIRLHQIKTLDEWFADRVPTVDNLLVSTAAESGFVGLLALLAVIVLFILLALDIYRRFPAASAGRRLVLALAGGATAFFVNGLTATVAHLYPVMMVMGVFFAALLILDRAAPQRPG